MSYNSDYLNDIEFQRFQENESPAHNRELFINWTKARDSSKIEMTVSNQTLTKYKFSKKSELLYFSTGLILGILLLATFHNTSILYNDNSQLHNSNQVRFHFQ